jgi:hypothetical protein
MRGGYYLSRDSSKVYVAQGFRMPKLGRLDRQFSTPALVRLGVWSHVGVQEPRGGVKLYDHLIENPVELRTLATGIPPASDMQETEQREPWFLFFTSR